MSIDYLLHMNYATMSVEMKEYIMRAIAPEIDKEPPDLVIEMFAGRENFDSVKAHLKEIIELIEAEE